MYHDAKLEKRNETNKFLAINYFNGRKNGSENESTASLEVTIARQKQIKNCVLFVFVLA